MAITIVTIFALVDKSWAQDILPVYSISPSFRTLIGENVSEVRVLHPVLLNLEVHNNYEEAYRAVIIMDVRDSAGSTVFMAWQNPRLSPNGDYSFMTSWLPEYTDEYAILVYVYKELPPIEPLAPVYRSKVLTVF